MKYHPAARGSRPAGSLNMHEGFESGGPPANGTPLTSGLSKRLYDMPGMGGKLPPRLTRSRTTHPPPRAYRSGSITCRATHL